MEEILVAIEDESIMHKDFHEMSDEEYMKHVHEEL